MKQDFTNWIQTIAENMQSKHEIVNEADGPELQRNGEPILKADHFGRIDREKAYELIHDLWEKLENDMADMVFEEMTDEELGVMLKKFNGIVDSKTRQLAEQYATRYTKEELMMKYYLERALPMYWDEMTKALADQLSINTINQVLEYALSLAQRRGMHVS